jgi:hypothetical protein
VQNTVVVNTDTYHGITGIEFDDTTSTLYAVYNNVLCSIDSDSGNVTFVANMWDSPAITALLTAYDSAYGRVVLSVFHSDFQQYRVAAYTVATGNFSITGEVGRVGTVVNVPQYIAYDTNSSCLWMLCDGRMGASLERVDLDSGLWKEVFTPENEEMQNWDCYDNNIAFGSLMTVDTNAGVVYANMIDDSSGDDQTTDLIHLDTRKLQIYEQVSLSTDATNYVYVPVAP